VLKGRLERLEEFGKLAMNVKGWEMLKISGEES
jgi:hypothetical protein